MKADWIAFPHPMTFSIINLIQYANEQLTVNFIIKVVKCNNHMMTHVYQSIKWKMFKLLQFMIEELSFEFLFVVAKLQINQELSGGSTKVHKPITCQVTNQ